MSDKLLEDNKKFYDTVLDTILVIYTYSLVIIFGNFWANVLVHGVLSAFNPLGLAAVLVYVIFWSYRFKVIVEEMNLKHSS